jgi:hypothetical protein
VLVTSRETGGRVIRAGGLISWTLRPSRTHVKPRSCGSPLALKPFRSRWEIHRHRSVDLYSAVDVGGCGTAGISSGESSLQRQGADDDDAVANGGENLCGLSQQWARVQSLHQCMWLLIAAAASIARSPSRMQSR